MDPWIHGFAAGAAASAAAVCTLSCTYKGCGDDSVSRLFLNTLIYFAISKSSAVEMIFRMCFCKLAFLIKHGCFNCPPSKL